MLRCWICGQKPVTRRWDDVWEAGCSDESCYAIFGFTTRKAAKRAWNKACLEMMILTLRDLLGQS